MKIIITGKPYRYVTEEKLRRVIEKTFNYLNEKLPSKINIIFIKEFKMINGFFDFLTGNIGFGYKFPEKKFYKYLSHEICHYIDFRKRKNKIWDTNYVYDTSGDKYLLNPHEYFAESVAVKLFGTKEDKKKMKRITKKWRELNDR